jgi:hypothetical protein
MTKRTGRMISLSFAVLAASALVFAPPANAQNLIESFFNSLGRVLQQPPPPARLPERVPAYAEPMHTIERTVTPPAERVATGPAKAYCVRTCDGHYFPVLAHSGMSAAEACQTFCPASRTQLYAGSTIDYAVARNGSRYTDLPTAYLYRRNLVAGCTCNGRNHFGLAHIDATSDPTLRPGDVVATPHGLVAFIGRKNDVAQFTPAASYPRFSKGFRDELAAMRVKSDTPGMPSEVSMKLEPEEGRDGNRRSAQR